MRDFSFKNVAIIIFNDIEVLDFCGPFEVFSVTRADENRRREIPSPFRVWLVAESPGIVTTSGGMRIIPDYTFEDAPQPDILVVPGGWGTRKEISNSVMLEWIRKAAAGAETVASVCTGSMLLGHTGLLDGKHATTHWRSLDWMRESFPEAVVEYDQHVVIDGSLLTSAGIFAGIDMALKVVERYCGRDIAEATARHMEYQFSENNVRRVQKR